MHNNQHSYQHSKQLNEGLEYGDLKRLVHPKLHIDQFKSKMGEDADIMLLSFKVGGKEPATDLMNFIERGYDWVLDADLSSGELDDGEYLVFVEMDRTPETVEQIEKLLDDLMNLTEQKVGEWRFQYRKDPQEFEITPDNLRKYVPLTPNSYISRFGEEEPDEVEDELDPEGDKELEAMQEAARVAVKKKAPVNDFTESLRIAAGLR